MALVFSCTNCGKMVGLTLADVGKAVICVACGQIHEIPNDIPLPRAPAADPGPTIDADVIPAIAPYGNWWKWAAAMIAIAPLIVATIIWTQRPRHDGKPPVATIPFAPPKGQPPIAVTPKVSPPSKSKPKPISPSADILPPPRDEGLTSGKTPIKPSDPVNPPPIPEKAAPSRPNIQPIREATQGVIDEQIGVAIQKGAEFLLSQFNGRQLRRIQSDPDAREAGLNALCVYALLHCGQAMGDDRLAARSKIMKPLVDRMREMPINGQTETYARGIRATALAVSNRPEDRRALRADVTWLVGAAHAGAYTYGAENYPGIWDNSNSQYGLLGVWSGAEVGLEVPRSYWSQVENHWTQCQEDSGEWGYNQPHGGDARLSMTAAGIASLLVTHDYLNNATYGKSVGRRPFSAALERGLKWLETDDNCLNVQSQWTSYTLYGLERVGLASGFKYFGAHDWYREIAARIIGSQDEAGYWTFSDGIRGFIGGRRIAGSDELVDTAYTLLFLARGRHPILMNKLRFDGFWANRPRDVSNLARFATQELERPLNWQIVPLQRDWTQWIDAPILYIASHEPIKLREEDYVKLRHYVDAGGLIFTQADGGSAEFTQFVEELSRKLFPDLTWRDLPPDHELYSLNFQINPKPHLRYLTNGARIVMLHSPDDITQNWQLRSEQSQRSSFELGVNLFVYAAGKADFRNRLSATWLSEPPHQGDFHVHLARVTYSGAWNPEPGALVRFSRWFEYQTGYQLDLTAVSLDELTPEKYPVAYLSGTEAWNPKKSEITAIRKFVEAGGVLLIEAVGGSQQFALSVTGEFLPTAFPKAQLSVLPVVHPILSGNQNGREVLSRAMLRPFAELKLGKDAGHMEMLSFGKGHVIFSPLDLSTGMLGINTWGILGYRPAYAQSFVKNVILWTLDGAKAQ